MGDTYCGKTSLLFNYFNMGSDGGTFYTYVYNDYEKTINGNNGEKIKLLLYDTNGVEKFRSIIYKKKSDGYVLVFDLTSKRSFENIKILLRELKDINNCPIVLFCNICDLINERTVFKEEVEEYANKNYLPYFETSAKINN